MIVLDQRDRVLECSICNEQSGIEEREMNNEAVLIVRMASVAYEHRGCERWAGNPQRAKAERSYVVRMRALMRELVC